VAFKDYVFLTSRSDLDTMALHKKDGAKGSTRASCFLTFKNLPKSVVVSIDL